MSADVVCNGKTPNLPSLEVVKKVDNTILYTSNMNWLLHLYFTRQDYATCRNLINAQLKDHLNPEYLYFVKGMIERKEDNLYEALRDFQKAIDINPKNVENFKEMGKTLYAMGRLKRALDVFREAERMINRPDHEVFHYIGELLYRNNQPKGSANTQGAKEYFQKALIHGKKLESYQRLAEIFRREKDYGKAIEVLESCLQIAPDNTEVLSGIGVLYLKINDTQNAFNRLLEVTSINERCPQGLIAFGAILQSRNDVDGALNKYQRITGEDLQGAELWNNIGLCFFKKKKLIAAIACLRKSIWMSPLNYNSLYNLSLVFITAQQFASAFQTLAAAINLRPDSAECYMLLGICLRKLQDLENAYIAFERASMLTDALKNPLIYLNFAVFCYETRRSDQAAANFNNFLRISSEMALPTEYKLYATKLRAVLPQSKDSPRARSEGISAGEVAVDAGDVVYDDDVDRITGSVGVGDEDGSPATKGRDVREVNATETESQSEVEKFAGSKDDA